MCILTPLKHDANVHFTEHVGKSFVQIFMLTKYNIIHLKHNTMNYKLLNELVASSKLGKSKIAEICGMSRTTLDNILSGSDTKISTIENLSHALGISASVLFDGDNTEYVQTIEQYKREIERLKALLYTRKPTKLVVELDINDDEFVKMGLKDKIVQVLKLKDEK